MIIDITDTIEAFVAIYPDGEVQGVCDNKSWAERASMGEEVQIVRLVPDSEVFIDDYP